MNRFERKITEWLNTYYAWRRRRNLLKRSNNITAKDFQRLRKWNHINTDYDVEGKLGK